MSIQSLSIGLGCGVLLGCGLAAQGLAQSSKIISHINIVSADGDSQRTLLTVPQHFEAPNWSPDGTYLLVNAEGRLYRLPIGGGEPELVDTGTIRNANNDHGISADGMQYVFSAGQIYLLPAAGGTPKQITQKTPSYFHGWSPDGRTLAYCAERGGKYDIYTISVYGGQEKQLTKNHGFNDGPDYSPDGKWIYFNSTRSGSMEIWRLPAGSADPDAHVEQVTDDGFENWFPHPSPDGRWLVFLSYDGDTKGHPPNRHVRLRLLPLHRGKPDRANIREVVGLFGGQGTINVNSWSPDSRFFAYVSYSLPSQESEK